MDVKPTRIRLRISELVVNGVPVSDRDALGEVICGELARLLTADDLSSALTGNGHIQSLDAGAVKVASPQAHALGTEVAQAVHGSLRK